MLIFALLLAASTPPDLHAELSRVAGWLQMSLFPGRYAPDLAFDAAVAEVHVAGVRSAPSPVPVDL